MSQSHVVLRRNQKLREKISEKWRNDVKKILITAMLVLLALGVAFSNASAADRMPYPEMSTPCEGWSVDRWVRPTSWGENWERHLGVEVGVTGPRGLVKTFYDLKPSGDWFDGPGMYQLHYELVFPNPDASGPTVRRVFGVVRFSHPTACPPRTFHVTKLTSVDSVYYVAPNGTIAENHIGQLMGIRAVNVQSGAVVWLPAANQGKILVGVSLEPGVYRFYGHGSDGSTGNDGLRIQVIGPGGRR